MLAVSWGMSASSTPEQQLHQAMSTIAQGPTPLIRKAVERAKRLLAQGADANALAEGLSPLSRLLQRMTAQQEEWLTRGMSKQAIDGVSTARHNARFEIVDTLLAAGADPWAGTTSTWALPRLEFGLYLMMILTTHEREHGRALRSEDGQTPLHAMLTRSDQNLHHYRLFQNSTAEGGLAPILHPDWIEMRDHEGNTPLHSLWQSVATTDPAEIDIEGGAKDLTEQLIGFQADGLGGWRAPGGESPTREAMETVWARLAARNQAGISVAEIILDMPAVVARFETLDQQDNTAWIATIGAARALAENARMEANTAAVASAGRGMRL